MDRFLITRRPLSIDRAYRAVLRPDCGGVCVFVGTVRNTHDAKRVRNISYTAFAEMALRTFRRFAVEARRKHGCRAVYVAHRTGVLKFTEASVIVAASAPHRAEAFAGCRLIIERLKKIAPIWKEEFYSRGKAWIGRR
ncbi:MAG: molybdenum cofactor biosynthesis protein MoaE [Planctomycetes bacterium]|nr:molybdenum cofactor biosynthesis protein MoaE [Planctomycetota bacterium]